MFHCAGVLYSGCWRRPANSKKTVCVWKCEAVLVGVFFFFPFFKWSLLGVCVIHPNADADDVEMRDCVYNPNYTSEQPMYGYATTTPDDG